MIGSRAGWRRLPLSGRLGGRSLRELGLVRRCGNTQRMMVLAGVLTSAGGVCELSGLILVVKEIADDRKRARRLFAARPRQAKPRRRYPGRALPRSASLPSRFSSAAEEQRAILPAISKLEADTFNAIVELRKTVERQLDDTAHELHSEIVAADDELRGHLWHVLGGSIRDRVIGAVLLAAGIAIQIAGAIIGAVAS